MAYNITLELNEVQHLINVLGDIPTKVGVAGILSQIIQQVNMQIEAEQADKPAE